MTKRVRLDDHGTTPRVRPHPAAPPKAKRAKAGANYLEFTEARVAGLRVKPRAYLAWDRDEPTTRRPKAQPGLAVMVMPSGRKNYVAHYNLPGNPTRGIAVGRVGEMTLEAARKRTRAIRDKADEGVDPRAGNDLAARIAALEAQLAKLKGEKEVADHAEVSRVTFKQLVEAWHKEELVGRKKNLSAGEVRGVVLYHTTAWHARPAGAITGNQLEALLVGIRDGTRTVRGKPPTANRLHSHLCTLFTWAARKKRAGITVSPMVGVDLPFKAEGRKRAWFADETADAVVKAVWLMAGELGGDKEKFLKLLVLLGKRRNAIQGMRWEHIAADWYWTPPKGSDIKRNNPIPLPKLAQRVAGARANAGKIMRVSEALAQELIRTVRTKLVLPDHVRERLGLPVPGLGLPDYLHHGLRHVFETRTGELGVPPHLRDLLLDHEMARSESGRGYDHGAYKAALAGALELWADHVAKLVTPKDETGQAASNVTVLR